MPFTASKLPQLTRFMTGWVTNRNPVDAPISMVGMQMVQHHDVLIDGNNTENSAYDTMQRRPGWVSFLTGTAIDTWQYKDLTGAISLFVDTGTTLKRGSTVVKTNSSGAGPWSLVGKGNFLYGSDGVDQIRLANTSLTAPIQWGQLAPETVPTLTFNSLKYFNAVTGFIPTADIVGGSIAISDPSNNRTLTITVNSATVNFQVTYTGNVISSNQSYTQTTVQTQTGTVPNTTTTDVVTVVNSYLDNVTQSGTTGGQMVYYPNTGISTLTFNVAFSAGTMTVGALATMINTYAAVNWAGKAINVPATAAQYLQVFTTATAVAGLYNTPGQPPFVGQTGVALNLQYNGLYTSYFANGGQQQVSFNVSMYDSTNPQYGLTAKNGSAPRLYQYVSPLVNVTDTFTGSIEMALVGATTVANNFTFTAQTMAQIAVTMENSNWNPIYVQNGTTCYLVVRNFQATNASTSQDSVLVMETNTLVDNMDANLNMQSWTFLSSNDWAQLPQQGVNIAYAIRDVFSGGLSNVSPPVTVGPQIYPCRWGVSLNLPYGVYNPAFPAVFNGNQNIEVYRTVDGGSSYLYEQIMAYQNLTSYTTTFSITDSGLDTQLVGPIDEQNDPPPQGLTNIISHTGRLWGTYKNFVYYAGGPDITNGNGDEAWPPSNYFEFPGTVTNIISTAWGLIVALHDDLHQILGVDSSSYYSKPWLTGFGMLSPTAWVYDKQSLYVYTTKQQLHQLNEDQQNEIGFNVGDRLLTYFPAATTSLTFHRGSSLDNALYVSNGTNTVFRYNPAQRAWSPKATPLVTAGRVKSLETSTGVTTLLNSTSSGVWARSLTTFSDNGVAYPAFFTVGTLQLAPQGQRTQLNNVAMQAQAVGTMPQVWCLFNEINSNSVPFIQLMNPVQDPPDLPPSQSIWAYRWYTQSTLTPLISSLINLAQIKVVFSSTDTVKNEILGIFLRDSI